VYQFDESTFTNAILKVTQTEQPAVYFTTGHGEYVPTDFDEQGLSTAVQILTLTNYKVETINFSTITETLPADTSAIIIAGPTSAFSPEDEKRLADYLDAGGRALMLFDPGTAFGLDGLLANWGVTVEDNLILEPAAPYRGILDAPVFQTFGFSPVTEGLEAIFLIGTRSLKETTVDDKLATALFSTTEESCAKTDLEALRTAAVPQCEAGDLRGPFTIGYAIEATGDAAGAEPDKRARLVIIGNASFLANAVMQNPDSRGNQLLFGNIVNWLAGQETLIAIPPREPDDRPLDVITGSDENLIFWTSVGMIPLAALVIASLMWWRRR
jgi:ABC-type uncharacterized transport system involved in gliding motility auxiliary subunit